MPIISVEDPTPGSVFGGSFARLAQLEAQRSGGLDPLASSDNAPPPTPTFSETWRARAGLTLVQSFADAVYRQSFPVAQDFNPFKYIRETPALMRDPAVQELVARGQFDRSGSPDEFNADLALGRRYLDDSATISRSGNGAAFASWVGAVVGDPTNLLPLGAAFKLARTGTTAAQVFKAATLAGGISLGVESLHNALQPASNAPGPSNELLALGTGAAFGGVIGFLGSPTVRDAVQGYVGTRKLNQLRGDFQRALVEPAVRVVDGSGVATAADVARVPLGQEISNGVARLRQVLAEDPIDNRVVSALTRPGDEAAGLLDQLRTKYTEAGKALHVIEHPDQWYQNLTGEVAKVLDHPTFRSEASPKDFDYGLLDAASTALSGRYAKLQGVVTPGGRVANTTLGALSDVYRTLSGSAQTITKGSATDPINYPSGTAAESLKAVYGAQKDSALVGLREVYAGIRREGRGSIEYGGEQIGGRFDYGKFRQAVHDVLRRENAAARGFDVKLPENLDLAIRKGADIVRGYFLRMADEGELSGFLQPARVALAKVERQVQESTFPETPDLPQLLETRDHLRNAVARQQNYLPRVYDVPAILADPQGFRQALVDSFRDADGLAGGKVLPPDLRPLVPEVVEKVSPSPVMSATGGNVATEPGASLPGFAEPTPQRSPLPAYKVENGVARRLTEGDLPPDLRTAYRAELDAFYRRNADAAFDKLTKPSERHGLVDGSDENPVARRTLDADESRLTPYLVQDVEQIIDRYHHVAGGRIAVRRSIQLNGQVWDGQTLANGAPIRTGEDLLTFLRERVRTLEDFARLSDQQAGRDVGGRGSALPDIRRIRARVEQDIRTPLDLLEGRTIGGGDETGALAAFSYFGRNALRLSFLNKLGSVAWAQLNDLAPLTMYAMQSPRTLRLIPSAILRLKSLPARDLQLMGLLFDNVSRASSLASLENPTSGLGFGEGSVRRLTAATERGAMALTDVASRVTGMNFITDVNKRFGGVLVLDRLTDFSRRLVRAEEMIAGGASRAKALESVGLDAYQAGWLNKLGLNAERARLYQKLTYEHGLTLEDKPIRDVATPNEWYGKHGAKRWEGVVKPNFSEWPADLTTGDGRSAKDLLDILTSNVSSEVSRSIIPTPGAFDKPLINNTTLGRIFNQFQAIGFAFTNQRLRVIAQMPFRYQLSHAMIYLAFGAAADAISAQLAGRRSLDETAKLWADNPLGATYAAWDRSGLGGWLGRPLAAADALGLPFAPGQVLGTTPSSTAARHIQPGRPLTLLGPVAADVDAMARVASDLGAGRADANTAYTAWKLAPFQNLVWWRLAHQATGAPVVPEAIRPPRQQR